MIKQWSIAIGIAGSLLGGAVAAQEAKPARPPATGTGKAPAGDAQNGKKLYMAVGCYQCHGTVAHGSPRTGPTLLTTMPFEPFLRQLRRPEEMPPYGAKVLSDQQAADIYAFIQTLPRPVDYKTIKLLQQ
jgi:mono/diheme cytochrome c family protein